MVFHALTEIDQETWYVDTGCKFFFVNLDESFPFSGEFWG